jgi:hypothetical protein
MVDLFTLILPAICIAIGISNTSIILAIFAAPKIKYVRMRKANTSHGMEGKQKCLINNMSSFLRIID